MKKFLIVSLLFYPALTEAQVIHGHPQKAAYVNQADWPVFSTQCHWKPVNQDSVGHTHVDLKAPFYAEIDKAVVATFTIIAFHINGVVRINDSEGIKDIILDAPGVMNGDPNGIKSWTGRLTIDPTIFTRWYTPHGWWAPLLSVMTTLTNGDTMSVRIIPTFYSNLNPNVEETSELRAPIYSARCNPNSATHPDISWGDNIVETYNYLPLAPISSPYAIWASTAGYGAVDLPPAIFQQRVDLDLHNNIPGHILKEITQDSDINTLATFDPLELGSGSHKMALFRTQQSVDKTEEVSTLMVFNVTVGSGITPPPVDMCPNIDGIQIVVPTGLVIVGGQCVSPAPPPALRPNSIMQLGTENRFFSCPTGVVDVTKCKELVVK